MLKKIIFFPRYRKKSEYFITNFLNLSLEVWPNSIHGLDSFTLTVLDKTYTTNVRNCLLSNTFQVHRNGALLEEVKIPDDPNHSHWKLKRSWNQNFFPFESFESAVLIVTSSNISVRLKLTFSKISNEDWCKGFVVVKLPPLCSKTFQLWFKINIWGQNDKYLKFL